MALFKIFKGNDSAKLTDPTAAGYKTPVDGYAYYDTTSKLFYIDAAYPGAAGITRQPINAKKADIATLADATIYETTEETNSPLHKIREYYGHGLSFEDNILTLQDGANNSLSTVTFGALASVNAVSGTYTPAGSISQAAIHISPKTTSVSKVKTAGNVSTLTSSVSNEVLSFNFNGGAMPTFDAVTVWNGYNTGIANSYVETQTFTGTEATITLSPVTGGAQNGDNVHF